MYLNFQFKFSTPLDTFLIIFGISLAFSMGSAMPILCILFGDTLQVRNMFFEYKLNSLQPGFC